jgi:hypothetical protein
VTKGIIKFLKMPIGKSGVSGGIPFTTTTLYSQRRLKTIDAFDQIQFKSHTPLIYGFRRTP